MGSWLSLFHLHSQFTLGGWGQPAFFIQSMPETCHKGADIVIDVQVGQHSKNGQKAQYIRSPHIY